MNKLSQKLELVTNLLVIVVAVAIGFILVQRYFFSAAPASPQARVQPTVGEKLNVSAEDFSSHPKTLVFALQTSCHFCNESAAFYKRIIEDTQNKNVKLVAVFPIDVEESKAHLNKLGLSSMEVKSSSLDDIHVSGTPTLILTNEKGEITGYWVGKLTPDKETEVLNKLNS